MFAAHQLLKFANKSKATSWIFSSLISGLIFFSSTNWYVHGLWSDYLVGKIYPADLIGLLLLAIYLFENKNILLKNILAQKNKFSQFNNWLMIAYLTLGVRQLFSPWWYVGLTWWLRLGIFAGLLFLAATKTKLFKTSRVVITLFWVQLFQFIVAGMQFLTQKSIGGYSFFGESTLSQFSGISHGVWFGQELILPYGTLAHPNILAGWFGLTTIWLVFLQPKPIFMWLSVIITFLINLVTQSLSGLMAFSSFVSLTFLPKIIKRQFVITGVVIACLIFTIPIFTQFISQLLPLDSVSLSRRVWLLNSAQSMLPQTGLWGTGLGQFVARLPESIPNQETISFLQPVHHIGWLWLNETGIIGLLLLGLGLKKLSQFISPKNSLGLLATFSMILIMGSLDHFLLTQTNCLYLMAIILGLAVAKER